MDDLAVLNGDDGDEPVVVGRAGCENLAVYFVFKDHDAGVLTAVYDESVTGVNADGFAISGEAGDEIGASSNDERPAREVITGLEDCIVGKRVEIMLAIDEPAQALHDNFKERIHGLVSWIF